jgi:hypothetical protein
MSGDKVLVRPVILKNKNNKELCQYNNKLLTDGINMKS